MAVQAGDRVGQGARAAAGTDGRRRLARRWRGSRAVRVREEVEDEVREVLYGWRSGGVERCAHDAHAEERGPAAGDDRAARTA